MDFEQATFEDGLAMVAERYADTKMVKLSFDWSKITESLKGLGTSASKHLSNPWVASPLIGAGIGGTAGLASAAFQPEGRRNYLGRGLTGAVLGGLGGTAVQTTRSALAEAGNAGAGTDAQTNDDIMKQVANTHKELASHPGAATSNMRKLYDNKTRGRTGDAIKEFLSPQKAQVSPDYMGPNTSAGVGASVAATAMARDTAKRFTSPLSRFGGSKWIRPGGTSSKVFDRIANPEAQKAMQDATSWLKHKWGDSWGDAGTRMQKLHGPTPMSDAAATQVGMRKGTEPAINSYAEAVKKLEAAGKIKANNLPVRQAMSKVRALEHNITNLEAKLKTVMDPTQATQRYKIRLAIKAQQGQLQAAKHRVKDVNATFRGPRTDARNILGKIKTGLPNIGDPKTLPRITPDRIASSLPGAGTTPGKWGVTKSLGKSLGKGMLGGGLHYGLYEALKRYINEPGSTATRVYQNEIRNLLGKLQQ